MPKRKPRADWVVLDAKEQVIRCDRCGETRPLNKFIPAEVRVFVRRTQAFSALHEDCPPKEKP